MPGSRASSSVMISVVVPVYSEAPVIREFHSRLTAVLADFSWPVEIIYVNDGSTDDTLLILHQMKVMDSRIAVLDLSRNFGKEIAMTAGLDHASGSAVVVIDADLQDPPELIPKLVECWREGYDVVYAKRTVRDGESAMKKLTAFAFYRIMRRLSCNVHVPEDTGDFRLLSRRAVDALLELRERNRFMKGLFAWIGFAQTSVPYRRAPRAAGTSKWNYFKLWNFALEGITSFSTAPLKVATYIGALTAIGAFLFGGWIVLKTLLFGETVAGYPSLMAVVTFLGGVQLMATGILGEYMGRTFDETKQRPLYLVKEFSPAQLAAEQSLNASAQEIA